MTAEIAILNKSGVALAADSAVTIGTSDKKVKIFNTANKLFNLNKYYPIGIMIYHNSNFMELPWETIVKSYRSDIGNTICDTIEEQGKNFIDYLINNVDIFSQAKRIEFINNYIEFYFNLLKKELEIRITEATKGKNPANGLLILDDIINEQLSLLNNSPFYNNFNNNDIKNFISTNSSSIDIVIKKNFQKMPINLSSKNNLKTLAASIFYKNSAMDNMFLTGIVITGFGKKEFFPSLIAFELLYFINTQLKYKMINNDKSIAGSLIRPYAQFDMVYSFIDGINPFIRQTADSSLREMFIKISNDLNNLPELNTLSQKDKDNLVAGIKKLNDENFTAFRNKFNNLINSRFREPVVNSVSNLPKEELASIAESLVYLAFLRKRITEEPETVGGEIDVAVISKGDGFIWIKRKHYFKPELNPHFFKNYFK